ncbi:hypothetical protein MTO96_018405 [Rhipicephalus appendiculatus]
MAELSTCFVVLFIGTLYLTGVSRQSALISYTAYKNGKCYFRGREYTPGDHVNGELGCMQLSCVKEKQHPRFPQSVHVWQSGDST